MEALMILGFLAWVIATIIGVVLLIKEIIKKQPKKKALIFFGVAIVGFVMMMVGGFNTDTSSTDNNEQKEVSVVDEPLQEELETIEENTNETEEAVQIESRKEVQETDTIEDNSNEIELTNEDESQEQETKNVNAVTQNPTKENPENKERGIRDETLRGHGWSDSGREEPQYVGIIGYAADTTNSSLHDNDKFAETPWTVPIYQQDKQFYNEIGTIEHKTEVLVLKQELKHEGYGNYSGYLTVEDLQTGEQYLLNVSNFITKPYWTYSDMVEAVSAGNFVAEFNQVSDYYPVNKSNEKVELEDGTIVYAIGKTGLYGKNGPDDDTNQIEAVVFKEWKYGYGGVSVYFNKDDLKIIY